MSELAEKLDELVTTASTEHHVLAVDEDDGWSLQHPTRCLPDLLSCALHKRLALDPDLAWDSGILGQAWVELDEIEGEIALFAGDVPIRTAATEMKGLAPTLATFAAAALRALEAEQAWQDHRDECSFECWHAPHHGEFCDAGRELVSEAFGLRGQALALAEPLREAMETDALAGAATERSE